jgi:hypothetical protein
MSERKCLHCSTAATDAHRLKTCSRCKAVSYCNTTCQHADWPTHKLVCNKHDGLRLGYAGATEDSIVFQDTTGSTSDEVYTLDTSIPLRMPPSADFPQGMFILLELSPAVAVELAALPDEEWLSVQQTASESMADSVSEDTIRQTIVEAIEMAKKARVTVQGDEAAVEQEGEGDTVGGIDEDAEDDEDDDEVEAGLWEKVRKVFAIKY